MPYLNLILLIAGLTGLWGGAKWIIRGAEEIARRYNLSHTLVGIGILAVGTDLPEIFVSIKASILNLQGTPSSGIITGNAIGSCISQITIILGIAGLFLNFTMSRKEIYRDGAALLASLLLLYIFGRNGTIDRIEGGILLTVYIIYYLALFKTLQNKEKRGQVEKKITNVKLIALLSSGFILLIFASHLVVENAILLAKIWGVEQSFIGISIVGLGTSLPELAVSVSAAFRKSVGFSIGNIIGSNIFDGLIPIGLGGVISTTNLENNLLRFDLPVLTGVTLLVMTFLFTKRGISVLEGIFLIFIYLAYLFIKFLYF